MNWKTSKGLLLGALLATSASLTSVESGFQRNIRTDSTAGTTWFQNTALYEQRIHNATFGRVSGWVPQDHTPPAPIANLAPIVIVNSSGIDPSRIYFLGTGTDISTGNQHFLQPNLSTGVCSTVSPSSANSADSQISVPLSQLPKSGTNSYLIYLPQQISGRCYLSINAPLYLETTNTTISPPSVGSPRDPTFYTLYQNFELTLDANYELWSNVSNVDFFCLPMKISSRTYPSGDLYPTLDGLTVVGMEPTTTRNTVLSGVASILTNSDETVPSKQWPNLSIPYYNNPYTDSTAATTIRILSAKQSIPFAGNQFVDANVPFATFNDDYLQDATSGPQDSKTYMQTLGNYYLYSGGRTLGMIIYPAGQVPATYSIRGVDGTPNLLQFTCTAGGGPNFTVNLSNLTTIALLGGDVGVWDADSVFNPSGVDVWNTEVAKTLSALFSAGQLPPTSDLVEPIDSQESYFAPYRQYYFGSPNDDQFDLHGPWYNLYSSALHGYMIKTNGYGLGYAYDYDDLLALGGEMHVKIGSGSTVNTDYPYYVLTLGSVDTTIPNPTESFGPYQLTINPIGGSAAPIKIYYSTSSTGEPTESVDAPQTPSPAEQINGMYNYFIIEYYTGTVNAKKFKVYPKHQYVIPYTNSYTTTDAGLASDISFISVAGSGTEFTISLPNL